MYNKKRDLEYYLEDVDSKKDGLLRNINNSKILTDEEKDNFTKRLTEASEQYSNKKKKNMSREAIKGALIGAGLGGISGAAAGIGENGYFGPIRMADQVARADARNSALALRFLYPNKTYRQAYDEIYSKSFSRNLKKSLDERKKDKIGTLTKGVPIKSLVGMSIGAGIGALNGALNGANSSVYSDEYNNYVDAKNKVKDEYKKTLKERKQADENQYSLEKIARKKISDSTELSNIVLSNIKNKKSKKLPSLTLKSGLTAASIPAGAALAAVTTKKIRDSINKEKEENSKLSKKELEEKIKKIKEDFVTDVGSGAGKGVAAGVLAGAAGGGIIGYKKGQRASSKIMGGLLNHPLNSQNLKEVLESEIIKAEARENAGLGNMSPIYKILKNPKYKNKIPDKLSDLATPKLSNAIKATAAGIHGYNGLYYGGIAGTVLGGGAGAANNKIRQYIANKELKNRQNSELTASGSIEKKAMSDEKYYKKEALLNELDKRKHLLASNAIAGGIIGAGMGGMHYYSMANLANQIAKERSGNKNLVDPLKAAKNGAIKMGVAQSILMAGAAARRKAALKKQVEKERERRKELGLPY